MAGAAPDRFIGAADVEQLAVRRIAQPEDRPQALGELAKALFALVYSLLESWLITPLNYGKMTLATLLHLPPVVVAIALAALFLTAVSIMPTYRGVTGGGDPSA